MKNKSTFLNYMNKQRIIFFCFLLFFSVGIFSSCNNEEESGVKFDPNKSIEVTGFYPDSGGIATPIMINGVNFGSDTLGLNVYFVDTLGVKHNAGVVGTNGSQIYALVPKLTFLREMDLMVEKKSQDGKLITGTANKKFLYKTQSAVTTVVGKPEPNNLTVSTVGGDFATATLSAPTAICLDNEDNIFITERYYNLQVGNSGQRARTDQGVYVNSNLVMADTKNQSVVVLQYNTPYLNAPAFSNEEDFEAVYVPEDAGLYYYQLLKSLNYTPRHRAVILDEESTNVITGNYKYSFVVNEIDKMIYCVMYRGELIRINPKTRNVEVLLDKVTPDIPNARGYSNSNIYCIFSPIEPNMLYLSLEDYNMISRIDISKLHEYDKQTYKGEFYAGRSILEGPVAGRGWEDGLLKQARFFAPKQIAFTEDGKLYIADTLNHCIRVIDTTVPVGQAIVSTAIGLPENPGFQDGGPEFAKFNLPAGVAVNADGTEIYVADTKNHVIRKLAIQ